MTSWECLDCDAQASADAADSGMVNLSREWHEMAAEHDTITTDGRDSVDANQ